MHPLRLRIPWIPMTLVAAAYFVAGKLGLMLAGVHPSATVVWPPTGIAIAACLLCGYRIWPGLFLAAFLVNWTTLGTWATSAGIATGNTLEGVLGAYLTVRFARGRLAFERAHDVVKFIGLAGLVSPLISATVGVMSLSLGGFAPWARFGAIWFTWWLGDVAGAIIITPLILLWSAPQRWKLRDWEIAFALLLGALVGLLVFGGASPVSIGRYPMGFLLFPIVIWMAFRFGARAAITVIFLIAVMAIVGTLRGFGPFALLSKYDSLLLLQAYLGVLTMTGLVVAANVAERKRAEDRFRVVVEAAPNAMLMINRRGEIVLANPQAEQLFGYARDTLIGRHIEMLIPERFRARHPDHRRGFFDAPEARPMGAGRDLFGLTKDGREVPVEIGLNPIETPDGFFVLASIIDISKRRLAEEALRTINETLERRVAERTHALATANEELRKEEAARKQLEQEIFEVSEREQQRIGQDLHDGLCQQLSGVAFLSKALAQKLRQQALSEAADAEHVAGLVTQAIAQTRDLVKGLVPVELEAGGLAAALQTLASNMTTAQCRISCVCTGEQPLTGSNVVTAIHLYRIAQEAVMNAVKHSRAERVVVTLDYRHGMLTLSVEDDGVGLPASVQKHGVGFASMRHRAELIGALLQVDSGAAGGTTVTCVWILRNGQEPAPVTMTAHHEDALRG